MRRVKDRGANTHRVGRTAENLEGENSSPTSAVVVGPVKADSWVQTNAWKVKYVPSLCLRVVFEPNTLRCVAKHHARAPLMVVLCRCKLLQEQPKYAC